MLISRPVQKLPAIFNLTHFHFHTFRSSTTSLDYLNSHITNFLTYTQTLISPSSLSQSHALIITSGNSNNRFISAKLISLYSSTQNLNHSTKVFNTITPKDPFLWNSIIKSHFSNNNYHNAVDLYRRMRVCEVNMLPNQFTVPLVVTACAEIFNLEDGMRVHGLALKIGVLEGNVGVGCSLIFLYAKCGIVWDAGQVFDEMCVRDVVAWTAVIVGFVQNGECEIGLKRFCEMVRGCGGEDGERPNGRTVDGVLQGCVNLGGLWEGRCVHGFGLKIGVGCFMDVQCSLLSLYCKCGSVEDSVCAFSEVCDKDLISWTSIIGVYTKLGDVHKCLSYFFVMQVEGIHPDGVLISCVISAFCNSQRICEIRACHGFLLRNNYIMDDMVHDALLSLYSKSGQLNYSFKLFNTGNMRGKVSWNAIVGAYCKAGMDVECIDMFRQMQQLGIQLESHCLASAISSCSKLKATLMGRSLHSYALKISMDDDVSVANSFIDMYGKVGNITYGSRMFDLTKKDTVTWNTLISSHIRIGRATEALALFDEMLSEGVKPNSATIVTVLSACSQLATLENGVRIHHYIQSNHYECNTSVYTALLDMYSKCGKIDVSREIFDSMSERDAISWNVMISSYGLHGDADSAIGLFHQMENSDATPNDVTFLSVLSACSHAGLISEGKLIFNKMKDFSVSPNIKHYACMVDLLGKAGHLLEAEAFLHYMPILPDKGIWGALLSACVVHNEVEMGLRIAKLAIESNPGDDGFRVMASNLNSSAGIWDEAEKSRILMKELEVTKAVAWSSLGGRIDIE